MEQKTTPQEALQLTFLVRAILFIMIFTLFLPMISAWEWDNKGVYNETTRTMTIINLFGLGETIAKITLLSPYEVHVIRGEERLIAWYKIENFEEYDGRDVFGVIETVNLRNGRLINKNFKYKKENKEETKTTTLPQWKNVCSPITYSNGTSGQECTQIQTGTITEKIYGWEAFNKNNLLEVGNHTIGLFTEVGENENVDWVPTMYGVTNNFWAVWNETFDIGNMHAYRFDETAGAPEAVDQVSGNNLIISVGDFTSGGILGNMLNKSAEGILEANSTSRIEDSVNESKNRTINFWSSSNMDGFLFSYGNSAANKNILMRRSGGTWQVSAGGGGNNYDTGVTATNIMNMHTITYNGTTLSYYLNATLLGTFGHVYNTNSTKFYLGRPSWEPPGGILNGTMDELRIWNRSLSASEVIDLYNGGAGLIYQQATEIIVTLDSPADNLQIRNESILFSADFELIGEGNLTNATLYIWNSDDTLFGTNVTHINGTTNSTNLSLGGLVGGASYDWNYLACGLNSSEGTLCKFADVNRSLSILVLTVNSQTFNSITLEGNLDTFIINVSYDSSIHEISAQLIYDNVGFSATRAGSGDEALFTKILAIPSVSGETNVSFYWSLTITNGGTLVFNTTSINQTVRDFNIDNCTANPNRILNFSVVDEEFQTTLVANIEIAATILSSDRSVFVSNFSSSVNSTSVAVCFNSELLNNTLFVLDTLVKYSAENYATEYYNIVNATLSNATAAQNITLFDLNSSDSTEFRVTFTGENFLPAAGVLVFLDRQYIAENVFKTVELPITDPNGQTILHLVRNDVIYNIRFLDISGRVLGNFREITAFCEDPLLQNCQISLSAVSNVSATFKYDELTGLAFTSAPTFNNNTSTVSFDFVVPGGGVKTVTMNITRNDVFGNRTICQVSLTSSSGTLICPINPSISDTTLSSSVAVNGVTILLSTIEIDATTLGSIGYVLWFILTFVLIFGLGDSKNAVLISMFISYVGAVILGISRGTLIGFGAAGTWILIVTALAIWRLNRDKVQ